MTEIKLQKGEYSEERLKRFFLRNGYFAVRGLKFSYDGFEVTDIDLWLYGRPSFASREITIVDIKNKKTPQAIERIFWTIGLMKVLDVDNCMVATTEKRDSVRNFGKKNGVTVLDGSFIQKLAPPDNTRLSEEDLFNLFRHSSDSVTVNEHSKRYEDLKRVLLQGLNFSTCNYILHQTKYFLEQCITNPQQRISACRLLYCSIAYFLLCLDYIMKDLVYVDEEERKHKIDDGLKYGLTGKASIEKTIDLALKLTKQPYGLKREFMSVYENIPSDIIKDFFSKTDNLKKLFKQAIAFESYAYSTAYILPSELDNELRSVLSVVLDFSEVNRSTFFDAFAK